MPKPKKAPQPPKEVKGKLIDQDGDEVITEASQLGLDDEDEEEGANPEEADEEESDDAEEPAGGEEEDEPSEEEESTDEDPDATAADEEEADEEPADESPADPSESTDEVEIDGEKYTRAQLDEIFATGKKVADYKKKHPGYDPILLHKQFTKVTQELAETKRGIQPTAPKPAGEPAPAKPAADPSKPKADLSKYKAEDVAYFNELAAALGYVRADDLEQRELQGRVQGYESVKKQEINKFLDLHPEYKPENDAGDARWSALLSEFNLYKLPEDPHHFSTLLERAHGALNGTSQSFDKKKMDEIIAKKRAAKSGQSSSASGGGAAKPTAKPTSPKAQRLANLAANGGLQGFSKEELADMFGS